MRLFDKYGFLRDAAGEGGSGGEPVVNAGGDPPVNAGGGDGGSGAFWTDAFSDDVKTAIGDRTQEDIATDYLKQRQAASRRAEDVMKSEGLVKPPARDGEAGEFFDSMRPETVAAYAEKIGLGEDELSANDKVMMEASHKAGMHVDQFVKYRQEQELLTDEANKKSAETFVEGLKQDWGADYDIKSKLVERAMTDVGWSDADTAALTKANMSPEGYKAIMNRLAVIGEFTAEGGDKSGGGNGGGAAGGQGSAQEQIDAIKNTVAEKQGGVPTADQTRLLDKLYTEVHGE